MGSNQFQFVIKSPNRDFVIDLWDIGVTRSGQERDLCYLGASGLIVFCDTNRTTNRNVPNWIRSGSRYCSENVLPIAVCMNKLDLPFKEDSEVDDKKKITREIGILVRMMKKRMNVMFCEISNWAKFSVHEPLIWILQQLTGDDTLELTFPPMSNELHGQVNLELIREAINIRRQHNKLC